MNVIISLYKKILLNLKARRQVRLSRSRSGTLGIFIFIFIIAAFMALPVFYAVIQAFKPIDEIFAFPPRFFVRHPTLDNFKIVFQLAGNLWVPFSRYLFNSIFISVVGTALYVFISSMAAFSLAKGNFRGHSFISKLFVWTLLFTADVTALPRYMVIAKLGIINTYWAIILPGLAGTMGVFLMQQFITASIPDSTLEAARIDGASEYMIFFRIVMPSVKPAWLTVTILTFQLLWNTNPSSSQTYIFAENLKMLPSVLSSIAAGGIARVGAGSAVSVLMMIPPVIIFLIVQNAVMETMAHSGLK